MDEIAGESQTRPAAGNQEGLRKERDANRPNFTRLNAGLTRRAFLRLAATSGAVAAGRYAQQQAERSRAISVRYENNPLANTIQLIKGEFSVVNWDADSPRWAEAIKKAFEKAEFPMTPENLAIVLTLIKASSGFREVAPVYEKLAILSETDLSLIKKQWTGGPMEVNFDYVKKLEDITQEEALKKLNSLDHGVYYGIQMLREILSYYSGINDEERRLKCVFSDWNAGIGRSVRAGLQAAVAQLSGVPIKNTGLLLLEDSKSKKVPVIEGILQLVGDDQLTEGDIRDDLAKPTSEIRATRTWKAIESKLGHPIEPVPVDLPVPGAVGALKQILLQ